jgi:uncharacterized protein
VAAVSRSARIALSAIDRYRATFAREDGRCVFEPSCSEYARLAVARHGVLRGTTMTARRLWRCHGRNAGVTDYPD